MREIKYKESKRNLDYYKCLMCNKKWDEVISVEYISHGGLDDMPSVEYRNECPSCGMPVMYVDSSNVHYYSRTPQGG